MHVYPFCKDSFSKYQSNDWVFAAPQPQGQSGPFLLKIRLVKHLSTHLKKMFPCRSHPNQGLSLLPFDLRSWRNTMLFLSFSSASIAGLFAGIFLHSHTVHASRTLNTTATGPDLQTWWHPNGEKNYDSVVQQANVRQSHLYSSWVSSKSSSTSRSNATSGDTLYVETLYTYLSLYWC